MVTLKTIFSTTCVLLSRKVNAGILQLTLGIGIIICTLCASMILLVYYSQTIFLYQNIDDRLRNNAASGIQYGMAMKDQLQYGEKNTIDLFGDEIDTTEIVRKPWGIFEVIVSTARHYRRSATKTALVAAQPDAYGKAAIYSPENNSPIYLVGDASITGEVYVPERKFGTGYINGKDFLGKKLHTGKAYSSNTTILPLDSVLLKEMAALVNHEQGNYKVTPLSSLPMRTEFSFSSENSNYLFATTQLFIAESLKGNLIIHSTERLRVSADAKLSNIILIGRDIDIEDGFKGSIQCFASRTITVGQDCELEYPSALVLMNGADSLIVIRDNAKVNGYVVIPGFDQTIAGRGTFKIEKKGTLHGMAYINGAADIQGSVWGHITVKHFIASSGSGRYSNHILDGNITSKKRSPFLPASLLWGNSKNLTVAKWLN
jgi:hypothetical protein